MQGPAPSLTLDAVRADRGGRALYTDLSLSLKPGEAILLRGPNGCGKSSLLRQISGFLPASQGSISYIDKNGAPLMPADCVALLEEIPALKPQESLFQMLSFHAILARGQRAAETEIENVARLLGLLALLDVPIRYFSTGQRRRAALARLALSGRAIWLLDEPLNGLDRESRTATAKLLHKHLETGGAMVIASHDPIDVPFRQEIMLSDYAPNWTEPAA